MLPTLTLLHTADVHLDACLPDRQAYAHCRDGYWERRRRLIEAAFRRAVDLAIAEQVDLFLIASDLFDSNRPSQRTIAFAIQQLRRLPSPVVILPGNHDPYSADSVYRRVRFQRECGNLRVITRPTGERLAFPELDLALWGKADPGDDHRFRPLAGLPRRPRGQRWYVAMAHGDVLLPGRKPFGSAHIRPQEIAAADVDYLALGHWEPFEDVSQGDVRAVYCGAPLPLADSNSVEGSVAIAQLGEKGVTIRRLAVAPDIRKKAATPIAAAACWRYRFS